MPNITSTSSSSNDRVTKAFLKLSIFQKSISESKFFVECCASLEEYASDIKNIRCLALGSPVESNAALYQFAFTLALGDYCKIDRSHITFYDPIFNDDDREILELKSKCLIKEDSDTDRLNTLYFLPHASLEVTEKFINSKKPIFFLGNDLISHTDRLTKKKLDEKYSTLSLLVKKLEDNQNDKIDDGFIKLKPKKRRNKINIYQEPDVKYDYTKAYFSDITSTKFKEMDEKWGNAFSDLAFHHIMDV